MAHRSRALVSHYSVLGSIPTQDVSGIPFVRDSFTCTPPYWYLSVGNKIAVNPDRQSDR